MSRNGSGTYTLPAGNPVVTGTTISSTWANNTMSDIATALTGSIAADGQTPITANLPMSGYKITGLATGSAATDSVAYGQLIVLARAYAAYLSNASLTTVIPVDDTIPQVTEGTEILSISFTPKSATNRLRLRFQGQFSASGLIVCTAAVFSSASANALVAVGATAPSADYFSPLVLEKEYVPGVATSLTFSVRVGPASGSMRMNGNTATRIYGGVSGATLVIEEITP